MYRLLQHLVAMALTLQLLADTGKTVSHAPQGARGRLRHSNHDQRVGLAVEAYAGDSMRHTEALILVVALLAKRPDTLQTQLLLQERSSISQTYVAAQYQLRFRLPYTRGRGL